MFKNKVKYGLATLVLFFLCVVDLTPLQGQSYNTIFQDGDDGWIGSSIGIPANSEELYETSVVWKPFSLPSSDQPLFGVLFSGKNYNGQVFLYAYRKISDLRPNAIYQIVFNTSIYLQHKPYHGIGTLYVKGGTLAKVPATLSDIECNFNKGSIGSDGLDLIVIDSMVAGTKEFKKYTVQNYTKPFIGHTNSDGDLYVIFGVEPSCDFSLIPDVYLNAMRLVFRYQGPYTPDLKKKALNIYPSLENDIFYFDTELESEIVTVSVYSESGHLIQVNYYDNPFYEHTLNAENLSQGGYYVVFSLRDGKEIVEKIEVN
ncbi:MAG: hypothetical protein RRX93_04590 [Bacteroidales bacterium]